MDVKQLRKKTRILTTLFGVLAAVFMGLMPLTKFFLSPNVSFMLFNVGVLCFGITMLLIIFSLVIGKSTLSKFIAIPITYVIGMIGYVLYQLNIYSMVKVFLGVEVKDVDKVFENTTSVHKTLMLLHIGVWVCMIPVVIYSIYKAIKLKKVDGSKLKGYMKVVGRIISIEDTKVRMNRVAVYRIVLEIKSHTGEVYEVTKETRIPITSLNKFSIGTEVFVLTNPKNREEFYIKNEYGIF